MIIDVIQGSDEWKALRRTKVTATDTSSILGVNPYRNIVECFYEKTGLSEVVVNDAMRRGTELEPLARQRFIEQTGYDVNPVVVVSNEYPWMMASMDGVSPNGKIGVEIKCGTSAHKAALQGHIPQYYLIQMYHQMIVTGLRSLYYYAFNVDAGILMTVHLNQSYVDQIISETKKFHDDVMNLRIPQPRPIDIWDISQEEWNKRVELAWRNYESVDAIT